MKPRWLRIAGAAVALWAVASAVPASAETCALQLKRIETATGRTTGPPSAFMFRSVYPQRFYRQIGVKLPTRPGQSDEEEFAKVVTKEPASYNSPSPFRAVAKLGTQQFGFVLDSRQVEEQPDAAAGASKPAARPAGAKVAPRPLTYDRLLFDLNGNGDLTDDPVIERPPQAAGADPFSSVYANFSFPRVDLTIDVDGTKVEYAFVLSGYSQSRYLNESQLYQYAYVSLNAAAYREGEITLDGQPVQIVVTDYNSNGRFDDLSVIDDSVMGTEGTVYPRQGDMIYVDPHKATAASLSSYDPTASDSQHYLSQVLNVGGRFYDVQITPAGDRLTLQPSSLAAGHVRNANRGYRALVYGDQGLLKISGDAEGRALLPAGSWKLLMYTIDQSERGEAAKPAEAAEAKPSLLDTLAGALLGSRPQPARPRYTMVSARAKRDYPAVEVRAGETAELPFGPPYKPQVTAAMQSAEQVSLGMSLVGIGGEICSNLIVDGGRPAKPAFTITDPDGKVVERGTFEYG